MPRTAQRRRGPGWAGGDRRHGPRAFWRSRAPVVLVLACSSPAGAAYLGFDLVDRAASAHCDEPDPAAPSRRGRPAAHRPAAAPARGRRGCPTDGAARPAARRRPLVPARRPRPRCRPCRGRRRRRPRAVRCSDGDGNGASRRRRPSCSPRGGARGARARPPFETTAWPGGTGPDRPGRRRRPSPSGANPGEPDAWPTPCGRR